MVFVFIVSVLMLFIGVGLCIIAVRNSDNGYSSENKVWGTIALIVGIILLLTSCIRLVQPGNVGVVVLYDRMYKNYKYGNNNVK